MMLIAISLLSLLSAESPNPMKRMDPLLPDPSRLEVSGTQGIPFMGVCLDSEGVQRKTFEGVTPTEISLEMGLHKCQVSTKKDTPRGQLKLKLSQKSKVIWNKDSEAPTAGIELQIPLSK